MTTLIITLPLAGSEAAAQYDYTLSADGLTASSHASVPVALLPATHDEVVALVPAPALSWHRVKLPAGSVPRTLSGERASARLRTILESVLEDQLLDDPAHLHLALQPQASDDALMWVAVCDRAWLKAGLAALAQGGVAVNRIVPEFTPQGLIDTVVVTGDPDHPRVAGLQRKPAAVDASGGLMEGPLNAQALLWLGESEAQADAQLLPRVVAEPAVAALAESWFKRPVTLQQRAERVLLAAQSPWDLAQFDLAHAKRDRRWASVRQAVDSVLHAPQWRPARFVLVLGVLANLVGLNAWALREQATLNAKRQAVNAVFLETFPKVPVVVDAPLQMAREVAALQRATGAAAGTDFESMLASFSAAAPEEYAVTTIEFVAGELRMRGPDMADAPAAVARLQAAGLRATRQGDQWLVSAGGPP